ncbi:MAG: UDP-N-acetylmuramate dehydrogenase [Anaerolineaceae bacterium]|nr:MAG: UDP-N-acetylmuramate dehydrogenase [Anaerolineaceae bacterium]
MMADYLRDEPLARYTAARLGGAADYLYIARDSVAELARVVSDAWERGLPVRVLGAGANVLVADGGFRGLVVVNRVSEVSFGAWYGGVTLSASSGASLSTVANRCQKRGLTGMEWAVSVPGTIGGAVVNNAGAHGGEIADNLSSVAVLDEGMPRLYTNADLAYEYRGSALKHRTKRDFLVLLATFKLESDEPDAIRARMNQMTAYRKRTQPPGASLGSIFKNPAGDYAGRLIEAAGLKGYRRGGVMVSPVHANFIVNADTASATSADYHALIREVQQAVAVHSGIQLELEIELIGDF